jgi:hypothetical protein
MGRWDGDGFRLRRNDEAGAGLTGRLQREQISTPTLPLQISSTSPLIIAVSI